MVFLERKNTQKKSFKSLNVLLKQQNEYFEKMSKEWQYQLKYFNSVISKRIRIEKQYIQRIESLANDCDNSLKKFANSRFKSPYCTLISMYSELLRDLASAKNIFVNDLKFQIIDSLSQIDAVVTHVTQEATVINNELQDVLFKSFSFADNKSYIDYTASVKKELSWSEKLENELRCELEEKTEIVKSEKRNISSEAIIQRNKKVLQSHINETDMCRNEYILEIKSKNYVWDVLFQECLPDILDAIDRTSNISIKDAWKAIYESEHALCAEVQNRLVKEENISSGQYAGHVHFLDFDQAEVKLNIYDPVNYIIYSEGTKFLLTEKYLRFQDEYQKIDQEIEKINQTMVLASEKWYLKDQNEDNPDKITQITMRGSIFDLNQNRWKCKHEYLLELVNNIVNLKLKKGCREIFCNIMKDFYDHKVPIGRSRLSKANHIHPLTNFGGNLEDMYLETKYHVPYIVEFLVCSILSHGNKLFDQQTLKESRENISLVRKLQIKYELGMAISESSSHVLTSFIVLEKFLKGLKNFLQRKYFLCFLTNENNDELIDVTEFNDDHFAANVNKFFHELPLHSFHLLQYLTRFIKIYDRCENIPESTIKTIISLLTSSMIPDVDESNIENTLEYEVMAKFLKFYEDIFPSEKQYIQSEIPFERIFTGIIPDHIKRNLIDNRNQ